MNLKGKKELASRCLKVGKDRIVFPNSGLEEIKEAITKQDIRDLSKNGIIKIKPINGRKKILKKSKKKSPGNIKKKVKKKKQEYVRITRKLRKYILELKKQEKISPEEHREMRKKIKNRAFKSKANLKEYVGGLKK